MISEASHWFNQIVADVEWQDGITEGQRRIALNYAYEMLTEALNSGANMERVHLAVTESVRRLANVLRNGLTVPTVEAKG